MPLPSGYSFPKSEKKEFDLLPADAYEVTIKDIEDKVSYFKNEDGSDKQVFSFTFSIEEEKYKGRLVWKEAAPYVKAGGDKKPSTLYTIIAAAYGRELTRDEIDSFGPEQVNSLIGKKLRVILNQKTSASGKTYNNAVSFLPSKLEPSAPVGGGVATPDIPFINF